MLLLKLVRSSGSQPQGRDLSKASLYEAKSLEIQIKYFYDFKYFHLFPNWEIWHTFNLIDMRVSFPHKSLRSEQFLQQSLCPFWYTWILEWTRTLMWCRWVPLCCSISPGNVLTPLWEELAGQTPDAAAAIKTGETHQASSACGTDRVPPLSGKCVGLSPFLIPKYLFYFAIVWEPPSRFPPVMELHKKPASADVSSTHTAAGAHGDRGGVRTGRLVPGRGRHFLHRDRPAAQRRSRAQLRHQESDPLLTVASPPEHPRDESRPLRHLKRFYMFTGSSVMWLFATTASYTRLIFASLG